MVKIKTQMNCWVDSSLIQMCREARIDEFSKILEFGMRFKLAELDLCNMPDNKLTQRIKKLQELLEEKCKIEQE